MSILGHSARLLLHHADVLEFESRWNAMGFATHAANADPEKTYVRVSDGQIIVSCMKGATTELKVVYFNESLSGLCSTLDASAVQYVHVEGSHVELTLPGSLKVVVHQQPVEMQVSPTKEQNPLIGHFDSLTVVTPDLKTSQLELEKIGFFVQEQVVGAVSRLDMTDGLVVLSYRSTGSQKNFLTYATAFDNDLITDLKDVSESGSVERRTQSGDLLFVDVPMPGGVSIIVSPDDEWEGE